MNKQVIKAKVFKPFTPHNSFGDEYEIYEIIELRSFQNIESLVYAWLILGCHVEFYYE